MSLKTKIKKSSKSRKPLKSRRTKNNPGCDDINLIEENADQKIWQVIYDYRGEQVPTELTDYLTAINRIKRFRGHASLYMYKKVSI